MAGAIHHTVLAVADLEASLRFYRDGIGLDVLADREVEGDWPELFGGPSRHLRAVFLGDRTLEDVYAGVLELNAFASDVVMDTPHSDVVAGLSMISFFVDVQATLSRLADLQLGGRPRRVSQATPSGPIIIAVVRDPDGVRVLLTPGSITRPR
jgi:catechol 2,3-dioxygenase-like lactoylglutathione lyase family enzyme